MNKLKNFLRNIKYFPIRIKYKILGYQIGKQFIVGKNVNIERKGFKARNFVYIGQYSYIAPNTKIGNYCMLSDNVNIIGRDHVFDKVGTPIILSGRPKDESYTIINDDVWLGHAVTIMRGVTIGEGSIIAANSVVTKDIPPYTIYAGVPAKFLKYRFNSKKDVEKHKGRLEKLRKKL
jgi:acetyltransferase-like isoleucine patch superfamily enzyme